MNTDPLKGLGLTPTEIKVYLGLLKQGESLASRVSYNSQVERAVTYHTLEKLNRKGLVSSVIKENRKYFQAADPATLRRLLREKEDSLNEIIPLLTQLKSTENFPLSVQVYRGEEGFKTVMEDLIRHKAPYYILGYTGMGPKIARFWYIHWNKRRIKKKIARYLLIEKQDRRIDALKYPLTHVRVLPSTSTIASKSSIIIYGRNKVLLFLPLEEFAGICIENKETHDAYKRYFDFLWKNSKKIKKARIPLLVSESV